LIEEEDGEDKEEEEVKVERANKRRKQSMDSSSASSSTSSSAVESSSMQERYEATMLLSGVGDAMGYNNGRWEFNHSGAAILQELNTITGGVGVKALNVSGQRWRLSDGENLDFFLRDGLRQNRILI